MEAIICVLTDMGSIPIGVIRAGACIHAPSCRSFYDSQAAGRVFFLKGWSHCPYLACQMHVVRARASGHISATSK
jgi:hypothetical protein